MKGDYNYFGVYMETMKKLVERLLEIIQRFSKVAEYKI